MKEIVWSVILAAGKSTRMQQQKLILPFDGETIISKVVRSAIKMTGKNVVVVLGSDSGEVRKHAGNPSIHYCLNADYETGMLSSVICGFNALPKETQAVLLFLGDQPHIPVTVSEKILKEWRTSGKGIIIPTFHGKRGHPVLIEARFKQEIVQLNPEKGLKELMEKFPDEVCELECEASEITRDIDTPADYQYELNK